MATRQVIMLQSKFTKILKFSSPRVASDTVSKFQRHFCNCTKNVRDIQSKKFELPRQRFNQNIKVANFSSQRLEKRAGPLSWKGLLMFLAAGGGVWYYVRYLKMEKEKEKEKQRSKSIGKASLGGPFDLIDHDGNAKTDKDFLGQWLLIYFGFTHCPDICPDQLDKITTIIEVLDKTPGLPKIQPLFITVDPKRDDSKSIKDYLQDFHPRFIGLTGNEAQIKAVTKAYRVYYSAGPMDDDEDYIVDHTIITYLVDPDGNFIEYFGQNKTIEETSTTIGTRMLNYKFKK